MVFPQLARRAYGQAFVFVVGSGWLLWCLDGAALLASREHDPLAVVRGWLLALFSLTPLLIAVGSCAGLMHALARLYPLTESAASTLWSSFRAWLSPADVARGRRRSACLYAAAFLAALYAAGFRAVCEHIVVAFARPEYIAWALLGAQLGLCLGLLALLGPCVAVVGLTLQLLARRWPWIDRTLGYPLFVALGSLAVGCAALAWFVYVNALALSYLPIPDFVRVASAVSVAAALTWLHPHLPRAVTRAGAGVLIVSVLAALVHALVLRPDRPEPYKIAQHELLTGQLAHGALQLALDWDHDGYLPFVPPMDCAPRNPDIHPGGLEIPDNGVDEDCDGKDVDARPLPARGRHDYPLAASVEARPPVFFITVDVLTARALAQLGGRADLMPALSRYARTSALFTQCFAEGPSTRLSFPAIFTSRWDSQIAFDLQAKHPYPLRPSETTLAEALRELGYETVAITSDNYFSEQRWRGLLQGFDKVIEDAFRTTPRVPHTAERVATAMLNEIERKRAAPLFVWAHFFDAHSPHEVVADAPAKQKDPRALYEAELSHVDRVLGALLAKIESAYGGRAVVVITGDHGSAFDAPRHEKRNYGYDLSTAVLHVPLIVHGPWIAPRSIDTPVSTMDVMPTLLNIVRSRRKRQMEGMSLVPELTTGVATRPPELHHQLFLKEREWKKRDPLSIVSLRTERFNLVLDRDTGSYELYDYQNDYDERTDLANQPSHRSDFVALKDQLARYLALVAPRRPSAAVEPLPAGAPKRVDTSDDDQTAP